MHARSTSEPSPASSSPRAELASTLTTEPAGLSSGAASKTATSTPPWRIALAAASPARPPPTIITRSSLTSALHLAHEAVAAAVEKQRRRVGRAAERQDLADEDQ